MLKRKERKDIDFKMNEYELARYITFNGTDNDFTEEFWEHIRKILMDNKYLENAIQVITDRFGASTLNGIVTPALIIQNAEYVSKQVLEDLMDNLFGNYIDKDKTRLLIHSKDAAGISYFNLILMKHEIVLELFDQLTFTDEMISLYNSNGYDNETITLYLINPHIDLEYKKKFIQKMQEDDLLMLVETWKNDVIEGINDIYGITADISPFDSFVNADTEDMVDSILRIIDDRLNE